MLFAPDTEFLLMIFARGGQQRQYCSTRRRIVFVRGKYYWDMWANSHFVNKTIKLKNSRSNNLVYTVGVIPTSSALFFDILCCRCFRVGFKLNMFIYRKAVIRIIKFKLATIISIWYPKLFLYSCTCVLLLLFAPWQKEIKTNFR